jgi:hypothetical protein
MLLAIRMVLMSHEPSEHEHLEVLTYYGRTMASVQRFERAIIQLVRLIYPRLSESVAFEPAWRRLQKQLKKTDGPLAKVLSESGDQPEEVLEGIHYLLKGRKNLAHEFLLGYMIEGNAGVANDRENVTILEEAETDFLAWIAFIDALYEALALKFGVVTEDSDLPLADLREPCEQEDVRVLFTTYGTTMFAVQMWELSLKGLLIYFDLPGDDEDADFDDTWELVERTLTTAAGRSGDILRSKRMVRKSCTRSLSSSGTTATIWRTGSFLITRRLVGPEAWRSTPRC